MNLLIHDLSAAEWDSIAADYADWNVVSDTGFIRPCIGCFHCWTSGTGECVFRDGYHRMCALIHEADEMVVMSRYTCGGFSPFVKNVFDRSIGYVLPEFETAYGEMHHRKRFPGDKPVTFVFRGAGLSEEEKAKARAYVTALCRNLRGSVKDVVFEECAEAQTSANSACGEQGNPVCDREDVPAFEAQEKPCCGTEKAGVCGAEEPRSGILLIDGSLRGSARSNTNLFLKKLQAQLGEPAELISLSGGMDPGAAAGMIGRAATVVLGAPLYVDGLPSSVIRLLEEVRRQGAGEGCRLYALVNNGLYESRQNVNLLGMIRDFCSVCGMDWRGGIAIGAGEVVGTLMRGADKALWPARNAETCIAGFSRAVAAGRKIRDVYADPYLFPRRLYILIANVNWQRLKAQARARQRED